MSSRGRRGDWRVGVLVGTALAALAASAGAQPLTGDQAQDIVRRAIAKAETVVPGGINATISVVDREGNLLGCVRMTDTTGPAAGRSVALTSIVSGGGFGGLEPSSAFPAGVPVATSITATSKAGTAAFLSTGGNAFTTRTAAYIIQANFPPDVRNQPSGPLFGVQFSSLPTSDFFRLPLGLSADSGALPLYDAAGRCRGGIGVECNDTRGAATGTYGIDTRRPSGTASVEELIALAGQAGFAPARGIRADQILVNGIRLAYAFAEPPAATALAPDPTFFADEEGAGRLVVLFPFRDSPASILATVPLTNPLDGSATPILLNGMLGATLPGFHDGAGHLVTYAGVVNGGQQLTPTDVQQVLAQAYTNNGRLRAMIRRDRPQISRVNVSVCDVDGNILGFYRCPDAPIFGEDASLQKARSVAFMSRADCAAILGAAEPSFVLDPNGAAAPNNYSKYVGASVSAGLALNGTVALGDRSIGFMSRPNLPDGILHTLTGPLTARGALPAGSPSPVNVFSVFNTGMQTDVLLTNLVTFLGAYGAGGGGSEIANLTAFDANRNGDRPLATAPLTGVPARVSVGPDFPGRTLANGLQIFPGAVPLYKNGVLVGAVGISGDGIEQDDMNAYAGAGGVSQPLTVNYQQLGSVKRADFVNVGGLRLPYVKLPRAPFDGL